MKTFYVSQLELDYKDYIKRPATDKDYTNLIKEDAVIIDSSTNDIVAVYIKVPKKDTEVLRQVIKRVKYQKTRRTSGLSTDSRIFGYMPRETIRKDYCSSAALVRDQPKYHAIVANFGAKLAQYYQQLAPEVYMEHKKIADEKILPEWKMKGDLFTSGIINKNTQLNYHFDTGNFRDVYSNQMTFKEQCEGGYLCMPLYDLALEVADNTMLFFNGQKHLHGVTPFVNGVGGFRITLVYYTLQQMWKCDPVDDEVARIRNRKTEREKNRVKYLKGEVNFCQKCMTWTVPKGDICTKCNLKYREKKSFNKDIFTELGIDHKYIGVPFTSLPLEIQKILNNYKR